MPQFNQQAVVCVTSTDGIESEEDSEREKEKERWKDSVADMQNEG